MPVVNIGELHIIQHNVRHYYNNIDKLHADWLKENPDIILLNSTYLNPKENKYISFKSKECDYKVYITPKNLHNGSAILIKKSINHFPVNTKNNELLAVTVKTNTGLVTISTFYRCFNPQADNSTVPYQAFNQLFNRSHPVFFIGDLNLKHQALGMGMVKSNKEGKDFYSNCLSSSNINYIGPDFNTFFEGGKKSKCDLILGNKAAKELNQYIAQGNQNGSDHTSIHFRISSQPIKVKITPRSDYSKAKWKDFKASLSEYEIPNLEGMHLNEYKTVVSNLIHKISYEKEDKIPTINHKFVTNIPKQSQRTTKLINCIDNLEATLRQQVSAPNVVQKSLRSNLYSKYKESRNDDFSQHYSEIAANVDSALGTNTFWKKINQSKGNFTNSNTTIKSDGNIITKPEDVTKHFYSTWKPVWKPNPPSDNPEAIKIANKYDNWFEANQSLIAPHNIVDTSRLIKPTKEDEKMYFYKDQLLAPIVIEDVKFFQKQL